jgi:hypothetical protein
MAPAKNLPFTAIALTGALLAAPINGLTGGIQSTMRISVDVHRSTSFKVQNGADLTPAGADSAPSGFRSMFTAAPVLTINAAPVMPQVIVEVSADAAGAGGELGGGTSNGPDGEKQLSLKDLGVASPPASRRTEGTDLKQAFERAAGEIVYRLDLLNKVNVGRQSPIVISINL